MSKVQMLRALVKQRLTAAAEEIFGLFERTIAEYEEELCRSKEENERQQKLLDAVFKPQLRLHSADVQQLLVSKEEVPPEQQEWSTSLDQEDPPEPPHIKEEQEELWTSQEGKQLQGLEETDITKIPFTPVAVKTEEEEKPQSSQLHQSRTEENRDAEHLKTEAGEDCGASEPSRNSDPDSHLQPVRDYKTSRFDKHVAEDSDWTETSRSSYVSSYLSFLKNNDVHVNDLRSKTVKKSFSCSECGKRFVRKGDLKSHMLCHTGEKPFVCSICGKRFRQNSYLVAHMRIHTAEKPFTCSVCNSSFSQQGTLGQHMRIHTGEKPFSCSICGKRFTQKGSMTEHMTVHTGEKPFSCSVCGKGFNRQSHVKNHKCVYFTDTDVNINDHMLSSPNESWQIEEFSGFLNPL